MENTALVFWSLGRLASSWSLTCFHSLFLHILFLTFPVCTRALNLLWAHFPVLKMGTCDLEKFLFFSSKTEVILALAFPGPWLFIRKEC